MGIITNRMGYPDVLVRAVRNDRYDDGGSDITVSGLLGARHQRRLFREHGDQVIEDVEDRIWALYGQMKHYILELGGDTRWDVVEKRYFGSYPGIKDHPPVSWSGQVDHVWVGIDWAVLTDWKTTSVWSYLNRLDESKADWEAQCNLLSLLYMETEREACQTITARPISNVQVVLFLRDWRKGEYRQRPRDYPASPVVKVPLKLWSEEKQKSFLADRMEYHFGPDAYSTTECTAKERWDRPTTLAVKDHKKTRALRVLHSHSDAEAWMHSNGGDYIQERPGESVRCQGYCGVRRFCEYGKQFSDEEAA